MVSSDCTMKTCSKCGQEFPATTEYFASRKRNKSGLASVCRPCNAAYHREYCGNHREATRAKVKRHRDKFPEKQREYDHKRYWSDPEKARQRIRDNRTKPEVKIREKIKMREWVLAHYDRVLLAAKRRRDLKRCAEGDYSQDDIDTLMKTQNGKCWWCSGSLAEGYHIDHRIALSRGGTNWPNNLCLACPHCNVSKNDKMPWEWSDRLL